MRRIPASGKFRRHIMKAQTMLKGAFLTFCLIGMLAVPVAAAANGQGVNAQGQAIDQNLKDDLWANHHQNRLKEFDLHVQRATSVIGILDKYNIETTKVKATLTTISGKRAALDDALTTKDREELKTINADLVSLWKQIRMDMRDSVKAHYGKTTPGLNPQ
jgi:hypothetical protein